MKEEVLRKFVALIRVDPGLLGASQMQPWEGFKVEDGRCVFTLRALFESLAPELDMDYVRFRSELYRGSLNAGLLDLGYKIEVHHTTGHVDSSTYRLVQL